MYFIEQLDTVSKVPYDLSRSHHHGWHTFPTCIRMAKKDHATWDNIQRKKKNRQGKTKMTAGKRSGRR